MRTIKLLKYKTIQITFVLILIASHSFTQTFTKIDTSLVCTIGGNSHSSSWGDFNNDGLDDLIILNGNYADEGKFNQYLFVNNGDWNFQQVIDGPIVTDTTIYGAKSAAWGDYNNDGYLDLFVATYLNQNNLLYMNNGDGSFLQISEGSIVNEGGDSGPANWVDIDEDGYLDLYITNLREQKNFLYMNSGTNSFIKVSSGELAEHYLMRDLGGVWADFDNDKDLDLFGVTLIDGYRYLFENDGSGVFTSNTQSGLTEQSEAAWGWFPPAWGDYDNDGYLDVYVTTYGASWATAKDLLFHNKGDGTFEKVTSLEPVSANTPHDGSAWADLDNDGYLDLVISTYYEKYLKIYKNNGDGTFSKVESDATSGIGGHLSITDINKDGFLDIFVSRGHYSPFTNTIIANDGNSNSWINIKLEGVVSNKAAIGTRLKAKATIAGESVWQIRETGLTQHSLNAHFGFGDASKIDSLIVEWPAGQDTVLTDVDVNQFLTITEKIPANYLKAGFSADTSIGRGVLNVRFNDISAFDPANPIIRWSWDFNGDGVEDSDEQHPEIPFYSTEPASLDISLTVFNDTDSSTITKNGFIQLLKLTPDTGDDLTDWPVKVTASSIENPLYPCSNAIDNTIETRWGSQHGSDNEWLKIELDTVYNVGKLVIHWETAFGKEYKIATSLNNENWDTVFCEFSSNGNEDTINFTGIEARYVKLNGLKRATQWGFSILELEIFQSDGNEYETNCINSGGVTSVTSVELIDNISVYPNPFKEYVTFSVDLAQKANVSVELYDITGRKVVDIFSGAIPSGLQNITWERENLNPGIYFYEVRVKRNEYSQKYSGKLLLMN